jgi:hypothetical protein
MSNPVNTNDPVDLPPDAVAIMVWRDGFGPQPITIVISRASWDTNHKKVIDDNRFNPDSVYVFESPINGQGRKTVFHLQNVIGWAANISTGIVPVKV